MYIVADCKDHEFLQHNKVSEFKFLTKKISDEIQRIKKEKKEFMLNLNIEQLSIWNEIEDYLMDNNLTKSDYVKGEMVLEFNDSLDQVFCKGNINKHEVDIDIDEKGFKLMKDLSDYLEDLITE